MVDVEGIKNMASENPGSTGIVIPNHLEEALKPYKKGTQLSKEGVALAIRELIKANPGKVLTAPDFQRAAGTTAANKHLYELIKRGQVVRARPVDGEKGWRFVYHWVDKVIENEPEEPTTDLPVLPFTDEEFQKIKDSMEEYVDKKSGIILDEYIIGVLLYKQWLEKALKRAKSQRKDIVLKAVTKSP